MKKQLLNLLLLCAVIGALSLSACSAEIEENATATDAAGTEEVDMTAMSDKYVCPMFCEDDKVYKSPGSCPVCGMDRVQVNELTEAGKKELERKMHEAGHSHTGDDHGHEH